MDGWMGGWADRSVCASGAFYVVRSCSLLMKCQQWTGKKVTWSSLAWVDRRNGLDGGGGERHGRVCD